MEGMGEEDCTNTNTNIHDRINERRRKKISPEVNSAFCNFMPFPCTHFKILAWGFQFLRCFNLQTKANLKKRLRGFGSCGWGG